MDNRSTAHMEAAKHFETAAKHHREASKHHEAGEHEKADAAAKLAADHAGNAKEQLSKVSKHSTGTDANENSF